MKRSGGEFEIERIAQVLDFVESITVLEEAQWVSRLVSERYRALEAVEIARKISAESWDVGTLIEWEHGNCRGLIVKLGKRLVKARNLSTNVVWDVNPLLAQKITRKIT